MVNSWEFLILSTLTKLPDEEVLELFVGAMKFFGDDLLLERVGIEELKRMGRRSHVAGLLSYCRENESSARSFFHMKNLGR